MNHIKRCAVAGQVKRFCSRFAQGASSALGKVFALDYGRLMGDPFLPFAILKQRQALYGVGLR